MDGTILYLLMLLFHMTQTTVLLCEYCLACIIHVQVYSADCYFLDASGAFCNSGCCLLVIEILKCNAGLCLLLLMLIACVCVCVRDSSANVTGVSAAVRSEKLQTLEHKLYKAQEELMEFHRKKGEVSCIRYVILSAILLLLWFSYCQRVCAMISTFLHFTR